MVLSPGAVLEFRSIEVRNIQFADPVEFLFLSYSPGARLRLNNTVVFKMACVASQRILLTISSARRADNSSEPQQATLGEPWCRQQQPIQDCYVRSVIIANASVVLPLTPSGGGGYVAEALDTRLVCMAQVPDSCLQQFGPNACVLNDTQRLLAQDRTWELLTGEEGGSSSDRSGGGSSGEDGGGAGGDGPSARLLGPAIGASVGGGLLLLTGAATLLWGLRRRRLLRAVAADEPPSFYGLGRTVPAAGAVGSLLLSMYDMCRTSPKPAGEKAASEGLVGAKSVGLQAASSGPGSGGGSDTTTTTTTESITLRVGDVSIDTAVCLGQGSFGRVYQGVWQGRPVAVKVLQYGGELCKAVHNEVLLSQTLRHPNVVASLHFLQIGPDGSLQLAAAPPPPDDAGPADAVAAAAESVSRVRADSRISNAAATAAAAAMGVSASSEVSLSLSNGRGLTEEMTVEQALLSPGGPLLHSSTDTCSRLLANVRPGCTGAGVDRGGSALGGGNAAASGGGSGGADSEGVSGAGGCHRDYEGKVSLAAAPAAALLPGGAAAMEALWLASRLRAAGLLQLAGSAGGDAAGGGGSSHGFLVMELCARGSLAAWRSRLWREPGQLPNMLLLTRLALDIANGMSYIHRHGVCHGDLKLSNVLLSSAPLQLPSPSPSSVAQASFNTTEAAAVSAAAGAVSTAATATAATATAVASTLIPPSLQVAGPRVAESPTGREPLAGSPHQQQQHPTVAAAAQSGTVPAATAAAAAAALPRGAPPLPPGSVASPCGSICTGSSGRTTGSALERRALAEVYLRAKVCDFGLARVLGCDRTHVSTRPAGSPSHLAPEAWAEGHVSQQADCYAFGITMWELATGERPWSGLAPAAILHRVVLSSGRPPLPLWLPPAYAQLMVECWAQAPKDRPPFADVVRRLEAMVRSAAGPGAGAAGGCGGA